MFKYYQKTLKIVENLLNCIIVILLLPRNLIFRNVFKKNKRSDRIFVLGNGPSLKDDYNKIVTMKSESDSVMVVNSFSCAKEYEEIKPNYYVMADSAFFINDPEPHIKKVQEDAFGNMISKTNWDMTVIVPSYARFGEAFNRIKENPKIKVQLFKSTPIVGGSDAINNIFFKFGIANPLFQNVLTACLFYSIKMKFSNIILWGGDHSWHEGYIMQKDNVLYTKDKHFYDNKEKLIPHINADGTSVKVHEEFASLSRAFNSYHIIRSFAAVEGVSIKNFSDTSWIDAFDRQ
ncbi:6-hydroxymethylpterin diphosphokinase MptE-like protein [Chryseobacterium sp. MYb264]|uniref:6-hydroxymethylpterin diphosphokinase MptE-like protein n=1 Tax=Chryseobacterium sp. MYb264 TaxID=2745153 RepID=UPI002E139198|nr:6-hydroxymethylpterin diphosphokinase MptE-like protein [Chryseobacterium sp. MYb264]